MKILAILFAASLVGTAAFAETTVIHKEGPDGEKTVVKRDGPDGTTVRRTESTGSVGCETKSVKRTNEFGATSTKTKTDC